MADVKYNAETGQIAIPITGAAYDQKTGAIGDPVEKIYIFDKGQYRVNKKTGQIAVQHGGSWQVYDGPYKIERKIGGFRSPAKISYISNITGQEIDPPITGPEAFGVGAKQGVTLGFADELAGASGAVSPLIAGEGLDAAGKAYTENRDVARSELHEAQARHPYATTAGTVVGALPIAAVTGGGGALGTIATGTALGGAAALGGSEATDAKGMLIDTGIGAGTGFLLSSAGVLGTEVAKGLMPSGRAVTALEPVMDDVQAAIAKGGRPAEASQIMSDTLTSAAHSAPTTAAKYIPAAREALDEGYTRAISGIDDMLTADKAVDVVKRTADDMKLSANKLYPDAYSSPHPIPLVHQVLENPYFKQALPEAKKLAKAEGRNLDINYLTTYDIHNIRQALDDMKSAAFRSGSGNVGNAVKNLREEVSSAAYAVNPLLKAADLDYAAKSAFLRAVDAGSKAAYKPPEIVSQEFGALSAANQEGYRVGLASQFRAMMGKSASGRTPEKLLSVPNVAQKLETVGVPPEMIDDFAMTAAGKAGFADAIMSGSRTGKNIAFNKAITNPLENLTGGDVTATAMTAGAGAVTPVIRGVGRGFSKKTASLLVDALASSTPQKLQSLLRTSPQAIAPYIHTLMRELSITAPEKVSDLLGKFGVK